MITAKYESRSRFISSKGGDKDYKKVVLGYLLVVLSLITVITMDEKILLVRGSGKKRCGKYAQVTLLRF